MSLAIKFGDSTDENSVSGAIYFDAVTDYRKDYAGKLTEHPIEAGVSVSDHYVSSNPKIKISGIISHIDFSSVTDFLYLDDEPVINTNSQPASVQVSNLGSSLRKFVPGSIAQFLPTISASAFVDPSQRVNHKDTIEKSLRELLNGLYYNKERERWENRMTTTTLFEIDGLSPIPVFQDLVVTSFSVSETVENGDAVFVDLTMEQARFVTLEKAEAPKPKKGTSTSRSTAEKKNKGKAPSTPKSTPPESPSVVGSLENVVR